MVLDNLNTHTPAALYDTFIPGEARRILRKLDLRDTPTHGSWLNMAEIAFAVVAKPCLDQRLPEQASVCQRIAAWETRRNAAQALALAEELGMCPLMAHCHLGLGMLYRKINRREQARDELSTAIELYRPMEMTFWLPQAEATLAQV